MRSELKKIKYLKEGPRKKDQSSSNKKTMKKTLNQHVLTWLTRTQDDLAEKKVEKITKLKSQ